VAISSVEDTTLIAAALFVPFIQAGTTLVDGATSAASLAASISRLADVHSVAHSVVSIFPCAAAPYVVLLANPRSVLKAYVLTAELL
jgi:hypothetical protein